MKNRLVLAFFLLILASGAALAQTPDAELSAAPAAQWPFASTVCEGQTGAVLGLCLAYCDAMECDLANDLNPDTKPRARGKACNLVRSAFKQLAGDDLPCECPCWDDPNLPVWAEWLAGEVVASRCLLDEDVCINAGAPPQACTPPNGDAWLIYIGNRTVQHTSLGVQGLLPPSCGQGGVGGGAVHEVSVSQGTACGVQLNALIAASGLTCGF